ncbi:hypothetical protein BDN67DRAFT_1016222 [Paxillus ammoniavirescens]|nr:hypothetical protein BDN67DRAFT_1016222 [Paxillus ammoniavirescens]
MSSAKLKATSPLYNTEDQPAMFEAQNHFTIAAIAALSNSSFGQDLSDDTHQAAIRAIQRHGVHCDGAHYHTQTPGGLHPAHAVFNVQRKLEKKLFSRTVLVEVSLSDVFDAIAMQDCLDGGISILIRCPGSEASQDLTPEKITVDLYVTPRELVRNERISGDMAVLGQAFCQDHKIR